jgi:microsomal dipeptidase-like Zn-dependent dipeptidase
MRRIRSLVLLAFLGSSLTCAAAAQAQDRFSLANDCWTLKSTTSSVSDGPFFLKPTDLGSYMFYDANKAFLTADSSPGAPADGGLTRATDGGPQGDWTVEDAPGGFRVTLPANSKALGVRGGRLALVDPGQAGVFAFDPASGCAAFPEAETNATGTPSKGTSPFGEVRGLVDAHMHLMAFEFLGGDAHCGKPWDRYGITHAMVDCPDHTATHGLTPLEIALGGKAGHDPVGWPTFKDWPAYNSLTHEGSYWKWLERAWRGGLRLYVNLLVDNGKLCDIYPLKRNPCDEMNTVRLEAADTYKLQDYIDAQYGGPGKGWFRIVRDPYEARKVINDGKLAVVLGIENSRLFDCKEINDVPQCDRPHIDEELDQVYSMGVRDMEIVNKFDNALTGVAGDSGTTGDVVNGGQKLESNHFWDMQTCASGNPDESDREQATIFQHNNDALAAGVLSLVPPGGTLPVYGPPPHCNARGLTDLGRYVIQRMIDKRMIFDPDHMSVMARKQALDLLEANNYPGVVSSHSWSTPDAYPRIYKLGGFIAPYAGASESFVAKWKALKAMRDKRFYWGIGYGADMNGFGAQGPPRLGAKNPVKYPFKSFDGAVTLDRPTTGQRTWDINVDGVAQYGLYPDWVEDLRMQAGKGIVDDMARGAEAYLEMWERATGVPPAAPVSPTTALTSQSYGKLRLGDSYVATLQNAGQPATREGRVWTWNLADKQGKVVAVLTPGGTVGLIAKDAPGRGYKAIAARGVAKAAYVKLARLQ